MELKWKKLEELPIDTPIYRKVLLLYEGRLDGSATLCVGTNYWHVFLDNRDFNYEPMFDKKKRLENSLFAFGRFSERKIPRDKIKGWMFADDLIDLYDGK